jgi:hypothetical protein
MKISSLNPYLTIVNILFIQKQKNQSHPDIHIRTFLTLNHHNTNPARNDLTYPNKKLPARNDIGGNNIPTSLINKFYPQFISELPKHIQSPNAFILNFSESVNKNYIIDDIETFYNLQILNLSNF